MGNTKIAVVCFLAVALSIASPLPLSAQTFMRMATFLGSNGGGPLAPLIQATDGNFYGTTEAGGTFDAGTVFRITPQGRLTTLHVFCSQANCADGSSPMGGMVQAPNGNLYGTTLFGGTGFDECEPYLSCGAIFELTLSGKFSVLYSFCSVVNNNACTDGGKPFSSLIAGPNGNLYGTTSLGGTGSDPNCNGHEDCGTVFEITPSGKLTTLYNFCTQSGCPDGASPVAPLILGRNGDLYGTTQGGGTGGTIFEITPSGKFRTVYSFCVQTGCPDGYFPSSGLIQGTDGMLYGTTKYGGNVNFEAGTAFRMATAGQLTTLHVFCSVGFCLDGDIPNGPLVQASDGNLYGTTEFGGTNSGYTLYDCLGSGATCGIIFQLTTSGILTTLYDFCSAQKCTDGTIPAAGLIQGTNGTFYGTTSEAGDNACAGVYSHGGCGTVFSLSTGLSPFVQAQVNIGKIGQVVTILGNNLAGTTSVTFNGVPAAYRVASNTYLKAQVPTGATTGAIQVTTPSGTLTSNVAFQVLP